MSPTTSADVPAHPDGRMARYRDSGAWRSLPVGEELHQMAEIHADRDAVIDTQRSLTYRELDRRSDQVGAWLISKGLRPGDTVLFQTANRVETIIAWYGVLKAAAIPVCTLLRHRAHEIGAISEIVTPVAHIIDGEGSAEELHALARDNAEQHPSVQVFLAVGRDPDAADVHRIDRVGEDIAPADARGAVLAAQQSIKPVDVAVFQLSGGTTAAPKVIPRLHGEYWSNAVEESAALGRDENARIGHALPIVHNAGVVHALFGAHCVGGCLVLMDFTPPDQMLATLIACRVNDMMIGTPFLGLLDLPRWDELRRGLCRLCYAGSKLPHEAYARISEQGIWIGQLWGMAEGPWLLTRIDAAAEVRKDSVGVPLYADDEYKITDDKGIALVAEGQTGLLWFRGPSTIAGYAAADAHNKNAFDDGFLNTGDLARIVRHTDGSTSVAIEGRVKDVINRGGEKINTEEIEMLLLKHPGIVEAAVVAVADPRLGERACAYLVAPPGHQSIDLAQLQQHLETLGVARYKWPERLEWLADLPRTNTLKIDKKALREQAALAVGDRLRQASADAAPSRPGS